MPDLILHYLLLAPCHCPVAHITSTSPDRAWAVLFGADAEDMQRTHRLKPVNGDDYKTTPRPHRGRCPHLEQTA